jgi:GntR family transcriptional regulator
MKKQLVTVDGGPSRGAEPMEDALMERRIDRASPIPYYYQLRRIIEEAMTAGAVTPGDALPSEPALCTRFGVSRTVVRQALSDLQRDGLVLRVKGRGTFVAGQKVPESLAQSLLSLYEDAMARGHRVETRVLRLEMEPASPHVAAALHLQPSESIVLLERLRIVDGEPWDLTTAHLPSALCGRILDLDMEQLPLYHTLEEVLGLQLARGRRSIEAAQADSTIARHLDVPEGQPVLILKGITYLEDERPIEYFTGVHRGDRSRFDVDVVRRPTAPLNG